MMFRYFSKTSCHSHIWSLFVVGLLVRLTLASSSTWYDSVRSLDSYGNAVQLQHAQAAATQHGRLVVCLSLGDEVLLVSPQAAEGTHLKQSRDEISCVLARSENGVRAMVSSGIQADAHWLTQQMRIYHRLSWERYDTVGDVTSSLTVLQRLLRKFWQYNESDMRPTVHTTAASTLNWARPLGIQVLLLGSTVSDDNKIHVLRVEPSGVVSNDPDAVCHCIGQKGAQVESAVRRRLDEEAVDDKTILCNTGRVLRVVEKTLVGIVGKDTPLVVERISSDGGIATTVVGEISN